MAFTLRLLHTADQEAGLPAIQDAPNFSAVLNALRTAPLAVDGTLTLSSGDAFIPGAFFRASGDVDAVAGFDLGEFGRGDILIQNELGFQAIALGNHEFDLGTETLAELLTADGNYPGAEFPYLSTNLDFSTDENLAGLVVPDGAAPQNNTVSGSIVINEGGIDFGIIGATVPTLGNISSPGDVGIAPLDFDSTDPADLAALAAEIQPAIDALTGAGINHIILLSHMQQIAVEEALAELLDDVDIIMAGGSNTLLSDPTDPLRAGDVNEGPYPIVVQQDENGAPKDPVAVINTDGNYKYVGQLVVTFDANGIIDPASIDPNISGAYATDDAGVALLAGQGLDTTVDPEIQQIVDALDTSIQSQDGVIFGNTEVFLNGTRGDVRTQETNLGNLTADANLFYARQIDETVQVSLKNGGGIRDDIGVQTFPPGSTDPDDLLLLPPQANAAVDKEEGDISQLDISNSLRFNNGLTLLTLTAEGLKQVMEHAVAATEPGATPGQFPQVGGMRFSFDPTQQAIEFDADGNVVTEGERIQNLLLVNDDGEAIDVLVRDGEVVGNADREIRIVTLGFLAGPRDGTPGLGGDSYPFPALGTDVVNLEDEGVQTGTATSADDGTEQDALAEYLLANFSDDSFEAIDVEPDLDRRIQNLSNVSGVTANTFFRIRLRIEAGDDDDVLEGGLWRNICFGGGGDDIILGFKRKDRLVGQLGNDIIRGGRGADRVVGNGGQDILYGGGGADVIFGGVGVDVLIGGKRNDILIDGRGYDSDAAAGERTNLCIGGAGSDTFVLGLFSDRRFIRTRIRDFEVGVDVIGLDRGLSFSDLTIVSSRDDSGVVIKTETQVMAFLKNVSVTEITRESFVSVSVRNL